MRINGIKRPINRDRKQVRRSGSSFGESMGSIPSSQTGGTAFLSKPTAAANVSSVDSLLILQDVSGDSENRRKAILHGEDILDNLEEIKVSLLNGKVSMHRLMSLRTLISSRPAQYSDPHLKDLLDQIELRARVELAKLGH